MAAARAELRRHPRLVTDDKVILWRRRELIRLGFTMGQAQTLAVRGDADLHEIEGWLANGCTHATAIRIIAPLIEIA